MERDLKYFGKEMNKKNSDGEKEVGTSAEVILNESKESSNPSAKRNKQALANSKLSEFKCEKCDFLIVNINKFGDFYCRELDMKMRDLVKKCVHFKPKKIEPKKDSKYDLDDLKDFYKSVIKDLKNGNDENNIVGLIAVLNHEHLLVKQHKKEINKLISEFRKAGDRIVRQIKLRYGSDAKGSEYLEKLFKKEFEKLRQ